MSGLCIISAGDVKNGYTLALNFVLNFEKTCCALIQRIIHKDQSLLLIVKKSSLETRTAEVQGVFTYSPKGRLIFSCLPLQTPEVQEILYSFFKTRSVFCISGDAVYTDFLHRIVKSIYPSLNEEIHDYYFMENIRRTPEQRNSMLSIPEEFNCVRCGIRDLKGLIDLQLDYAVVEVLPKWKKVNPAAEGMSLEQTLKIQMTLGIKKDGKFIAKANSNAITPNYIQIGGVYTKPEFRGQGCAAYLVERLCAFAWDQKKNPVLFVRKENVSAIKAYTKCGFACCGENRIVYFEC